MSKGGKRNKQSFDGENFEKFSRTNKKRERRNFEKVKPWKDDRHKK